ASAPAFCFKNWFRRPDYGHSSIHCPCLVDRGDLIAAGARLKSGNPLTSAIFGTIFAVWLRCRPPRNPPILICNPSSLTTSGLRGNMVWLIILVEVNATAALEP